MRSGSENESLGDAIYPNGVNTSYGYDNLNRLLNLSATKASTTITNFTYTYDAVGNKIAKALPGYTEAYGYDAINQLTKVERTGALADLSTFSYDAVGNRLTNQKDGAVTTSSYNNKNQLVSVSGGGQMLWRGSLDEPGTVNFTTATVNGKPARMLPGNVFEALLSMQSGSNTVTVAARDTTGNVTTKNYSVNVTGDGASYTYDPNGNLATKTEGGNAFAYTWDAENRLTKVEENSIEVANFKYDALGRRVEKTEIGTTTSFAYDRRDILRQSGGATAGFVHGPGIDEPLARDEGGLLSYFHAEALGSVVASTNAAGATASSTRYDPWGMIEQGTPSPFGFTGREADASGLAYYRARYYDPSRGRFISEDPSGSGADINLYAYAEDNPVRWIDPSGLGAVPPNPNTPGQPPILCTYGSLGPPGCIPVPVTPIPKPNSQPTGPIMCAASTPKPCYSYLHHDLFRWCMVSLLGCGGNYTAFPATPISIAGNRPYCMSLATFCDEEGPADVPTCGVLPQAQNRSGGRPNQGPLVLPPRGRR